MKSALATRPADEARIRTYRDDYAHATRQDYEALAPERKRPPVTAEPKRPPVTVALVVLFAAMVFAAILGAWL